MSVNTDTISRIELQKMRLSAQPIAKSKNSKNRHIFIGTFVYGNKTQPRLLVVEMFVCVYFVLFSFFFHTPDCAFSPSRDGSRYVMPG